MSAVFAPSWPDSRVLLGWWRELADRQPRQMRFGHLLLHRLEALVRIRRLHSLDRWQHSLLRLAGTRLPCGEDPIKFLNDLQIDKQLLGQLVRELTANDLLHCNGDGLWQMTAQGRRALESSLLSTDAEERRTFVFADNSTLDRAPHFLSLQPASITEALAPPSIEATDSPFAIAHLEACIAQTAEWKARHRFPSDVEALLPPRSGDASTANLRRVILDAVAYHSFVFLHTVEANGASSLWGFPVRTENWTLPSKPLLALADGWRDALPDLAEEPSPESWRQAWRDWSQSRGLSDVEVEACRLERVAHRLLVHAPPSLLDRLRTTVKQEAWLLAGEGRTRVAAQIELQS
jgi:hypothetical protein